MKNSILIKIILIIVAISLTFIFTYFKGDKLGYVPFVISANKINVAPLDKTKIIEGTRNDDFIIANDDGSKIFSKGGLDYIILGDGNDEIYFSLCGAKIIDGKVSVIENFNPLQDKIKIFCAHHEILPDDIKIFHNKYKGKDFTYIHIKGQHRDSAFALLGNIKIDSGNIILNERFKN